MIKILFHQTGAKEIYELVSYINKYGQLFGVGTNIRLGHFLAQAREELGSKFGTVVDYFFGSSNQK